MRLTPMPKSNRAYAWIARDYSEGEMVDEKFAVRFKSDDLASKFHNAFDAGYVCKKSMKLQAQFIVFLILELMFLMY